VATASASQAAIRTTTQPKLAISRTTPHNLLQLWHLTSLDAPTVAVTWTMAFAWATNIHLPIWLPVTLALSAWTFYIADRLMDARTAYRIPKHPPNPTSDIANDKSSTWHASSHTYRLFTLHTSHSTLALRPRHHYHWQHRRIFLPAAVASALIALALVLHYMPLPARERNSILAAATLLYFATVHTPLKSSLKSLLKLPKELLVGILFTLACVLPVATRIPAELRLTPSPVLPPALAIATLLYIALAWLNCHAIDSWESSESHPEQPKGQGSIRRLALIQAILTATAAAATLHHPRISLLLLAATLSAILLLCLDRARSRLNPTTLRAAADLALLTPLLLLLF
jgi:hypothetical protein